MRNLINREFGIFGFRSRGLVALMGVLFACLLFFQNCSSPQSGSTPDKSTLGQDGMSGNGGGYTGKMYVNRGGNSTCTNPDTYNSQIVQRDSDQKFFLMQSACLPVNPPQEIPGTLINPTESIGPALVIYQARIYDYVGPIYGGTEYSSLAYCSLQIDAQTHIAITVATRLGDGLLQGFWQETKNGQPDWSSGAPVNQTISGTTYSFATQAGNMFPMNLDVFNFLSVGQKTGNMTYAKPMAPLTTVQGMACFTQN